MKWPEIRWGWGAAAILLLLPAALASQTTATPAPEKTGPVKWEVKSLALKGVKVVDPKDLRH